MKHLSHALVVAAAVFAAAASTLLASPAAQHFLENHPADATYVALASGALAAAWRAFKASQAKP